MANGKIWYKVRLALPVWDIVSDYLQAKRPKSMVQILADQCETKPARIKWVLWQCGVPVKLTGAGQSIESYGDLWMEMDGAACAAVRQKMIEWNGVGKVVENMENAEKSAVDPVCLVHAKTIHEEAPMLPEREVVAKEAGRRSGENGNTADFVVSMLWDYYLEQRGLGGITADMVDRMRKLMALGDRAAEIMEGN